MDDQLLRAGVIVIGHVMWLSTAALRALRGTRRQRVVQRASWPIELYPVFVWVPLVLATIVFRQGIELPDGWQLLGIATALAGSLFAATAMWSLGRSYGIRTDVFESHRLKTNGVYGVVRHPMYLGILVYHLGAALGLESLVLLAATALVMLPYSAARIAAEERVLRAAFGADYERYAARVPALLPLPR